MKKLLICLLPLVFFACKKEVKQTVEESASKKPKKEKKILVLQKNCLEELVTKLNKGKGRGKPPKPPQDTVVVDPPPPTEPYYGARVLYVNAYGKKVTTTVWTSPAYPVIDATPPANPDSVAKVFIETVKAYAEFQNLLVTDDSTIFNNTPIAYRGEVILTSFSSWYGIHAGGAAYTGSFGTGIEAFVFTDLLGDVAKFILAADVHELAHMLGLPHAAEGYYDVFGQWVLVSPYIITFGDYCNWMGAAYYATYGIFEDWAYDRYGVKVYQKNVIRATIAK